MSLRQVSGLILILLLLHDVLMHKVLASAEWDGLLLSLVSISLVILLCLGCLGAAWMLRVRIDNSPCLSSLELSILVLNML